MTKQSPHNGPDKDHQKTGEADLLYGAFRPKIEWRHVEALKPNPTNARTHTRKQRRSIAKSIQRLGFNNPILIDHANTIVAGHGRFEAAKEIGIFELPVIVLEHLDDDEVRAYMLADNQLAVLAGWDDETLAIELQNLVEVSFDLDVTGFEAAKIDFLIDAQIGAAGSDKADVVTEAQADQPPVSRIGDIWQLGPHRLMCGNALENKHYKALMGSAQANMMFSDPPFNVKIPGHVGGSGVIKHPDFVMASGEMDRPTFREFLLNFMTVASRFTTDGSISFICMDWRSIDLLVHAGLEVYSELKNICIWGKTNPGMGSLYRSQHEMVAVFKHGAANHRNNIELGRHGRNRSNVWTYAGVNTFKSDRMEELSMHPTVKPVALVADAIRDVSIRGDVVLDPFMGSGTTIIAAHDTGRKAYGLELDTVYVDTAVRRFQDYTGETAVHVVSGQTFADVEAQRTADAPPPPPTNDTDEDTSHG